MALGRTVTITGTCADASQLPVGGTGTAIIRSPLLDVNPNTVLTYYVAADVNNGELQGTGPLPFSVSPTTGAFSFVITAPQDVVATDYLGNHAANAYLQVTLPNGVTITTTNFAYSGSPIAIATVNNQTSPIPYTTAPVAIQAAQANQVGNQMLVTAYLNMDCFYTPSNIFVSRQTAFQVKLSSAGTGNLNLIANKPGTSLLTPADVTQLASNIVWQTQLGIGGPVVSLQVPAGGDTLKNCVVAYSGSGGVGAGVALEITDGTHDILGVTKLTVTGGTVGGSSAAATLAISGGAGTSFSWITKTANYTALASDTDILVDATAGAITITLPTAVASTQRVTVKKKDSSTNAVNVSTTSAQTIDGSAPPAAITLQGNSLTFISDGASGWWIE